MREQFLTNRLAERGDELETLKTAAHAVKAAWENLPTGNYSPRVIERWLSEDMTPAINELRKALA